jgi:hypothetical protein
MEILLGLVAVVVVGLFVYYNRQNKSLDVNNDGKVDLDDVKAATENVVQGVKSTVDVNQDGKVDVADAKEAVKKTAAKAKSTAKKVGSAVKGGGRGRPSGKVQKK